jgi:hypothetical protein
LGLREVHGMKKRILIGGPVLIILVFLLAACQSMPAGTEAFGGFVPAFEVTGDVEQPLMLKDLEEFTQSGVQLERSTGKTVSLGEILEKAVPASKDYSVLLIGDDGLTAEMEGASTADCHITFSEENAWEAINPKHPVSSNIKRIKEIVVVSDKESTSFGLNIINTMGNLDHITPGGLYKTPMLDLPMFEGRSTIEHDGRENWASIYTRRKMMSLGDIPCLLEAERPMAVARDGSQGFIDCDGYLELRGNSIDYLAPNLKDRIEDVVGIVTDPPGASNMDTYNDTAHFLDRDENVLVIILDGFGYHQYVHAIQGGYAPLLGSIAPANKALSVYTPVTNAGVAAILTGRPPSENGVHTRKEMDVLVPSIFGYANERGKTSVMVEGNIKILNLEIEPVLNIDKNKNGSTDDEIRDKALEIMDNGYNLMVVHFHGIDDSGHSYGDLSSQTMERIRTTDGYVKDLVSRWSGKVIITADHGMHSTSEGGSHGEFRYEDMIVPYIICEGDGEK